MHSTDSIRARSVVIRQCPKMRLLDEQQRGAAPIDRRTGSEDDIVRFGKQPSLPAPPRYWRLHASELSSDASQPERSPQRCKFVQKAR